MQVEQATRQVSGAPALSFTGLDISLIRPELGGKYSPNLYAFLSCRRNVRGLAPRARIYADRVQALWLGYFDDTGMFCGARLSQVLCNGAKAQVTCPVNLGALAEVTDFWERYLQVGRCAIDTKHIMYFLGDDARWSYSADKSERSCLWCNGASQRLFTRLVTRTDHQSNWVMQDK